MSFQTLISNHKTATLAVAIGENEIHLLYQSMRDDVTGIERVGLFYAHGTISQTPFGFQAPAG